MSTCGQGHRWSSSNDRTKGGLKVEIIVHFIQVALHTGPKADPDQRDKVDSSGVLKTITAYVAEHMPGLESTPSVVEACMYTVRTRGK